MKQVQLPGSLELAYLGDTLWDLFVREELVKTGGRMKELHRAAVARVRASARASSCARLKMPWGSLPHTSSPSAATQRASGIPNIPPRART